MQEAREIDKWNGILNRLHQITQPSLIITGTEDVVTSLTIAFIIAEQIPGAKEVMLNVTN